MKSHLTCGNRQNWLLLLEVNLISNYEPGFPDMGGGRGGGGGDNTKSPATNQCPQPTMRGTELALPHLVPPPFLKPFYIRNASKKDMEMWLCKLHLHCQWAVESLLQWAKKVKIEIAATNYRHVLSMLMIDCAPKQNTHIS